MRNKSERSGSLRYYTDLDRGIELGATRGFKVANDESLKAPRSLPSESVLVSPNNAPRHNVVSGSSGPSMQIRRKSPLGG